MRKYEDSPATSSPSIAISTDRERLKLDATDLAGAAQLAWLADETAEGRSSRTRKREKWFAWTVVGPAPGLLHSVYGEDRLPLGVIQPKDIIKGGKVERFNQMRQMGIKTVNDHW